jgi:hypothetical protein
METNASSLTSSNDASGTLENAAGSTATPRSNETRAAISGVNGFSVDRPQTEPV